MSKIYIGMGGWELYPFNKYFYPPKSKKGFRKLEYYSRYFDCMEINATFYNTSFEPKHAKQWLTDVSANKEFMFTVKLSRKFTHLFTATKEDVIAIKRMLDPLAEAGKLGGLIAQFHHTFVNRPEYQKYLMRVSNAFREYGLFVEVRHNSWNTPSTFSFFREQKMRFVNVDLPSVNQHIPLTSEGWDNAGYFRLMGRNEDAWNSPWRTEEDGKHVVSDRYNYNYSAEELADIEVRIELVKKRVDTVFVIFHNDPEANSLINGFQLRHILQNKERVHIPENLIKTHPELRTISIGEIHAPAVLQDTA